MIRYRLRKIGMDWQFSLYTEGKYKLKYMKGEITIAPEGTLGIFCFETSANAERFRRNSVASLQIYRVEAIGRGRKQTEISELLGEERLDEFYQDRSRRTNVSTFLTAPGLICYAKVKVLE